MSEKSSKSEKTQSSKAKASSSKSQSSQSSSKNSANKTSAQKTKKTQDEKSAVNKKSAKSENSSKNTANKTSPTKTSSQANSQSVKSSEEKPKTSSTTTKTSANKTSSSASKNPQSSAKSKKSKSKKKKISLWEIILIVAVVIFAVWFFYFGGKAKIDSFLSKNFNTTSSELLNPESENQNFSENSQLQAENLQGSAQNQQNLQNQQNQASETSQKSENSQESAFVKNIEIPLCPATLNGNAEDHEVHSYNGFQLCYRESYEDAEWVAYVLTRDELTGVTERSNKFHADKAISTGSATPSDYTNSGYDRGHLAPAADLLWSTESMDDSFLMSNMTPQAPDFNRGMWKSLEEQVRSWAETFGEVVVVTGPILEKDASEYKKIGKNQVAVPEYFYKVLLAQDSSGVKIGIAFILPNSKCEGSIWDYSTSIDEVEKRTNLDFFSLLEDSTENQIEANTNFDDWK